MSHQLETLANGETAFVSARIPAWHNLGTVIDHPMSAEEAMSIAHLRGWNVRKLPLTAAEPGAEPLPVPRNFAIGRTNPVTGATDLLGVVGRNYTPIQNEEQSDMLNALLHESHGQIETAGSLRGGREVFVSAKIPAHFTVGGVDPVDLYITALNSHDGTSPARFLVSPIRVVCANTQAAALKNARSTFAIRHTRNYRANIAVARQALGLALTYRDEFSIAAEKMINETMTEAAFDQIIKRLYPEPALDATPRIKRTADERYETLHRLYASSPTNTEIRGTQWAAYQAITEYTDHIAPTKLNAWTDTESGARSMRAVSPLITNLKEKAFTLTNA